MAETAAHSCGISDCFVFCRSVRFGGDRHPSQALAWRGSHNSQRLLPDNQRTHKTESYNARSDFDGRIERRDGRTVRNAGASGCPLFLGCRIRQEQLHGHDSNLFPNWQHLHDRLPMAVRLSDSDSVAMLALCSGWCCGWLVAWPPGFRPTLGSIAAESHLCLHGCQRGYSANGVVGDSFCKIYCGSPSQEIPQEFD